MSGIKIIDVKVVGICSKCRKEGDDIPRNNDGREYRDSELSCPGCAFVRKKPKRQGLRTSIKELRRVADELEKEQKETEKELGASVGDKFQINIINKTPEQSDTWRIER